MSVDAERAAPPPLPTGDSNENPSDISYWRLIDEDLKTHGEDWLSQGFWALFNHRFGNWRMGVRTKLLRAPLTFFYIFWYKLVQMLAGIDLPYTVKVGRRVKLEHFGGMILIARSIGDDVIIRHNTTFGVRSVEEIGGNPVIGAHADIGVGAVILGHVRIGDHAVIGANSVVLSDVPDHAVAVGAPARVVSVRRPAAEA